MAPPPLKSALVAEFFGTLLLVTAVGCCVTSGSPLGVTAIALTLMVSIYALGDVSGANFNPAVSLCLGLCGKLPWTHVGAYTAFQIFGGLTGGLWAYSFCLGDPSPSRPVLVPTSSIMMAMIGECLFTAMLCLVVLSVAATKSNKPNNHFGLAIGLTIIGGGHALGKVSGGILNPAVGIGLLPQIAMDPAVTAIAVFKDHLASLPMLVLGQLLGSVLAFGMYRVLHPEEFSEEADADSSPGTVSKLTAEFVGTFYLVLTVTLNVLAGNPLGAWSIAATLAAMVYSLGCVSGGHLNPSVSLALALRTETAELTWAYIVAQVLGGITAAQLAFPLSGTPWGSVHGLTDGAGFSYEMASACELVFTTLLVFAVLCIATVEGKDTRDLTGFIVGSCVTVGGFAVGRISGASLNPAVTLGLCSTKLLSNNFPMYALCFYLIDELLASGVAVSIFSSTHQVSLEAKQLFDDEDSEKGYGTSEKADLPTLGVSEEAPAAAVLGGSRRSVAAPAEAS